MRVELDRVGFHYGQASEPTLANVCFSLARGECALVLGASGAGKSTLLQLVAGLLRPSEGLIRVTADSGAAGRSALALQQPESQLFCTTVFDEVAYGLRHGYRAQQTRERPGLSLDVVTERTLQALRQVGLEPTKFASRHPLHLSGGEQRRLAIACCLALEPDMLLLDELVVGLDSPGTRRLLDVLAQERARGRSMLIATHAYEPLLRIADRLLLLHEGRIVANGPPEVLLEDPALFLGAGLEPFPLAQAAHALEARGWTDLVWRDPEQFAQSLLRARQQRRAGTSARVLTPVSTHAAD